jgi:hypothetical protein
MGLVADHVAGPLGAEGPEVDVCAVLHCQADGELAWVFDR